MLFSRALISYSRALTNAATSSSPVTEAAASLDCTGICRIFWVFWRFRSAEVMVTALRFFPVVWAGAEDMAFSQSDQVGRFGQVQSFRRNWTGPGSCGRISRVRGPGRPASRFGCTLLTPAYALSRFVKGVWAGYRVPTGRQVKTERLLYGAQLDLRTVGARVGTVCKAQDIIRHEGCLLYFYCSHHRVCRTGYNEAYSCTNP